LTVAYYFASDVHLRFDRPDRDVRFSNWLTRLTADDSLLIAGDLCDFWMASRSRTEELLQSQSLRRLAEFQRDGGTLSIMPGNHDAWLCPFYQDDLGARIVPDPFELTVFSLRIHLVHGHLLGSRPAWKAWLEGPRFFNTFGQIPHLFARALDRALIWKDDRTRTPDEERHLQFFRAYTSRFTGLADLVVIGHVHRAVDEPETNPRMIVLGGWQARSSFLKVDKEGAILNALDDPFSPGTATDNRPQATGAHEARLHED
jgi:UDP-2,3-diacylglucosamine hydrolase